MDKYNDKNDSQNIQSDMMSVMANTSINLELIESEQKAGLINYNKFPLSRLSAWGTAFQPLVSAIQTIAGGAGGSGIYFVNTYGGKMFNISGSKEFIGSIKTAAGTVGGGQARMTPLTCDPTMLFMAATLANIDKKLDKIQEKQQEIMDFLVQKERSELRGDLKFLFDVYNNYKFNWNNEMYKKNNHIKVLDIRQASERKIDFYREQITTKIDKKSFVHSEQTVKVQLKNIQAEFKDYQLALYLFGFSSFMEIMLLENFDSSYLSSVSLKLEDYSLKYRELYTQCYDQIKGYSTSSVESTLLKGIAGASRVFGKAVEKIPVISDSQIDETLIATGEKIQKYGDSKIDKSMSGFIDNQNSYVRPFIESINTVNRLHNSPVKIFVDKESLYIENIA